MAADESELLFFDTFSHEANEELNLDLVKFPRPVYIYEIRIIPLGSRVQADFPGGYRLGATNPSSFHLEFFVNDLSKREACTFAKMGSFEYKQNIDIQFPITTRIPTDGLVLHGWYRTITLAVYGVLTKVTKERTSPPPPPPQQVVTHPQVIANKTADTYEPQRSEPVVTSVNWERPAPHQEVLPEQPPPPPQPTREPPLYGEPPPPSICPVEQPMTIKYSEPVATSFTEHHTVASAAVPPAAPVPPPASTYNHYDAANYSKAWPAQEHSFQPPETYQAETYANSTSTWETQHPTMHEIQHEHPLYNQPVEHEHRPPVTELEWEKDSRIHEYRESEGSHRFEKELKRRDKDHRERGSSWERHSPDVADRYSRDRDRDRGRESSSRDRHRDRDRDRERGKERSKERGRDRDRGRDSRRDRRSSSRSRDSSRESRGSQHRPESRRPSSPPPSPSRHPRPRTPDAAFPGEPEKLSSGPRTPKDDNEPSVQSTEQVAPVTNTEGEAFEVLTPEQSPPEHIYNLSEGELQEGEPVEDDDGYEEIVSEEEYMSDGEERALDMVDIDYDIGDDTWNYMASFSPYQCEFTPLQHFHDPSLTLYEITKLKTVSLIKEGISEESQKLLDTVEHFVDKEHLEKWVEAVETVANTQLIPGLSGLRNHEMYQVVIQTLIEWILEGLDFNAALKQPQAAYKVRHMKAGIRLASSLFCTDKHIVDKLLELEVPAHLLKLYSQPYMTLPLKLLIIRALDAAVYTAAGMDHILHHQCKLPPLEQDEKHLFNGVKENPNNLSLENSKEDAGEVLTSVTCYQRLLEIMMKKQSTRATVAVTALLKKIHTFEVLYTLKHSVERVLEQSEELLGNENSEEQVVEPDEESNAIKNNIALEEEILNIVNALIEINSIYRNAKLLITQTLRCLPASTQFMLAEAPFDPFPGLFRLFRDCKLLESLFVLVSCPSTTCYSVVIRLVKEFLMNVVQSNQGMIFLLSDTDLINGIQRALLQFLDEGRDDSADEIIAQHLGLQLVYRLQVLQLVDLLLAFHAKSNSKEELDDPEAVHLLHQLYTMMFTVAGKTALVHVLSLEQNLEVLIPFVKVTGQEDFDAKLSKSVCSGYSTELLLLPVRYYESIGLLEKFADIFFELSQQEPTPKLHELASWMAPTRKLPGYGYEVVGQLMGYIKKYTDEASSLPPECITTLRILQHLAIAPSKEQGQQELRYKYVIIQIFSNDGMSVFLSMLQKICNVFLKPSHQSTALVGHQGSMVVAIIKPVVYILHSMLSYLISCQGPDFKDLTALPVLLPVHTLMSFVPVSSFSYPLAQKVQTKMIEILLAYTQPSLGSEESEEALNKSLWTQMIKELMVYTLKSPGTYVSGLIMLSELLPLPLPLQTKEPLNQEEVTRAVNNRKLWSAHLHALSDHVQEIISSLAATSCQPLQQLIRRICVQLCDLAAPSALVVVKSVLDDLITKMENQNPPADVKTETAAVDISPCNSATARILNLVAYLVSQASFKITLISILGGSVKTAEKYGEVLDKLLTLLHLSSDKIPHLHSQECIVSILQSLCDPDIGFITLENGATVTDTVSLCHDELTNSLPPRDQLSRICSALIQHVGDHQHPYASVLPSLRTLVMLAEHDLGMYHLKSGFEQNPKALHSLLIRLATTFTKESSDCFSTLSTALELLRLMVHGFEESPYQGQTARTQLLPIQELARLLDWQESTLPEPSDDNTSVSKENIHPLLKLENLFAEVPSDDEAVENLLENLSGLVQLLKGVTIKEKTEMVEPLLSTPDSLSAQFAERPVYQVGDIEEERLTPAYWLSVPGIEDTDQETEQISLDFVSLAEKYCFDLDIRTSLQQLCLSKDLEPETQIKKKMTANSLGKRKHQPFTNSNRGENQSKRPFIAPMRGRGFGRGPIHSTRTNDPFRSRPPNTSRPPSMHVDDFLAMEIHGPTNPPGPKRPGIKDAGRGRGRGFEGGRGFGPSRGRFFTPPGPYNRREPGRGLPRGAATRGMPSPWVARGGPGSAGKLGGPGMRGFGRGGHMEPRPTAQRLRDPYGPGLGSGRFTRGGRGGQSDPNHWSDLRSKAQDQRFQPPSGSARGRRENSSSRHARAFTR
ncbi:protein virilizer homolog isoform X2 [Limulus polyphemus]|uniref:Protein virilizer homolog isoform X2 n=1 Tax=Limulus polyphemus TaxID=6850 RepID=A0ABM1S8I5_LIMPO|nr:protein virilizer homolog isoform X2 [Limulus polyphemus]